MSANPLGEDIDEDHGRRLIERGTELGIDAVGVASGAAIEFAFGGPGSGLVGGLAGISIRARLRFVVYELKRRFVSPREEARMGGALREALLTIKERLDRGEQPRTDGFFEDDATKRSGARELLEGVLLQAAKSYEERKVIYLGRLFASVAFDATLSSARANQILGMTERLTYRQLVLLSIAGLQFEEGSSALGLRDNAYNMETNLPWDVYSTLIDAFEFYRGQLIGCSSREGGFSLAVVPVSLASARFVLLPLGSEVHRLMGLNSIRQDDPTEFEHLCGILKDE